METTTHTTSLDAEKDMTRCTTLLSETEKDNWYLLVITASVGQLNLAPEVMVPKDPELIYMMKTHSGICRWLPPSLDLPGQSVMEAPL